MSSNKVFASQFFGIQSPCTQRCKNNATNLQRFIESAWYERSSNTSHRAARADEGETKISGALCFLPRVLLDGLPGKSLRVMVLRMTLLMLVLLARRESRVSMVSSLALTSHVRRLLDALALDSWMTSFPLFSPQHLLPLCCSHNLLPHPHLYLLPPTAAAFPPQCGQLHLALQPPLSPPASCPGFPSPHQAALQQPP